MTSIKDISFINKKALIRVDFNVPFNGNSISDNSRILAAIPTINYVLENGGSCIVMSHLGRPKKRDKKLSLLRIKQELERLLDRVVIFVEDCIGPEVKKASETLKPGQVLLLENLRFYKEEVDGDEKFAEELSFLADIYVNDAYGTTHRAHASTSTIAKYFTKKSPGLLLQKEILSLKKVLESPKKPVTAIVGGAKVSSKISIIVNMLKVIDNLVIGGGMAYTFILNLGGKVGDSICEPENLGDCQEILDQAKKKNVRIFLPLDVVVSKSFSNNDKQKEVDIQNIPVGWQGLDIGRKTRKKFSDVIKQSNTILWNGPMGVFEMSSFQKGTKAVANAVAVATKKGSFSLVGGGDSVAAVKKFNLKDKMSFISTGGGAMLESLEGKVLPGIKALQ
tara:strand:- start:1061 stop:2239 length:1179 start_codon:yes stop_codon:yes gene_type:complete